MIDSKKAVENAKAALLAMYQDRKLKDVLLEEVDLTDNERVWAVTIAFTIEDLESAVSPAVDTSARAIPQRFHKIFVIDTETGAVKSMKIK